MGILDSKSCVVKIDGGIIKVIKGAMILMKGAIRANGLHVFNGHITEGISTIASPK